MATSGGSSEEPGPPDLGAPLLGAALLRLRPRSHRLLILAALVVLDLALYSVLQRRVEWNARPVYVLHVIAAGLLFGWRGGLLVGLGTVALGAGLNRVIGGRAWEQMVVSGLVVGGLALATIGSAVGAVTDLSRRLRDEIEQRKRMARELLEASLEAQFLRASRLASLGTLAAGVAHEINNPLAYLTSNLHSVRHALSGPGLPPPEELKDLHDALDESIEGAGRIEAIVKAIRVFSPRPPEELAELLDVRAVAASALEAVEDHLRDRATATCRIEGEPRVLGNGERLGQVLVNLLVNAAEAIPAGRPQANQVTVAGRVERDRVVVEISDTGAGIAPDVLPRIFEPFFSTKPHGTGTGLGLFVCKGIVTAMGGNLTARSEPEKGSTFTIDLPGHPPVRTGLSDISP